MNITGKCDSETRWQLRLLHAVLMARLATNAPKRIARQVSSAIKLLENVEIVMSETLQTSAGQAWFKRNRVDLHRRLLVGRVDDLESTYAHEIGHLVCGYLFQKYDHGTEWKICMHYLESDASRTHDIDVSAFRKPIDAMRRAA